MQGSCIESLQSNGACECRNWGWFTVLLCILLTIEIRGLPTYKHFLKIKRATKLVTQCTRTHYNVVCCNAYWGVVQNEYHCSTCYMSVHTF